MLCHFAFLTLIAATGSTLTFAQAADDGSPASAPAQNRKKAELPPPGVVIPEAERAELTAAAAELRKELDALALSLKAKPALLALMPDAEVFWKAVDWALRYNEFYNVKDTGTARTLLAEGKKRAAALREGQSPWTTQTGPVVRGYRSRIDGSVQPYGVVVPATWGGVADKKARPLWLWNHGRGDTSTELPFIAGRMKSAGEFTPADTFVVHPFGRYCNATKFAGETDVFEALASARERYPIDGDRLVNAGFSMGGASAWHLGVHHAGLWAASHAGAGFAETAEYAGVFAAGKTPPPWWEVILYRWYDATVDVANFANSPMFAYHGSEDKQGQSTAIMKRFAEKEGVKIEELIGPGVAHKYEPGTKKEVQAKIEAAVAKGRGAANEVRFVTYSLRYPQMKWVRLTALEQHWEHTEISAKVDGARITATTANVAALTFSTPSPDGPPASDRIKQFVLDGQTLPAVWTKAGAQFIKTNGKWATGIASTYKTTAMSGPIDDAFLDAFLFVKPTGTALTPKLGAWTQRELEHATKQWRAIFRGDAPAVDDTKLTAAQIAESNLVLWGDPSSNAVFKRIADKLPLKWTSDSLEFGGKKYALNHVPLLIFPNPLNPTKYVVLNSGFTFNRAAASGTNSLQTPKLPDWAIVDTSVPPDDKFPGQVVDAGFFDEQWKFTTERPK